MNKIAPIILCGGFATRLWPLSRSGFPEQFLVLTGTNSLFQQAVERVNGIVADDISVGETLVLINEEHRFLALDQLHELKSVVATLLLEPVGRLGGMEMPWPSRLANSAKRIAWTSMPTAWWGCRRDCKRSKAERGICRT